MYGKTYYDIVYFEEIINPCWEILFSRVKIPALTVLL